MKVLVAGAGGFIGSAVCARLFAEGHTVIGAGRGRAPQPGGAIARWASVDFTTATAAEWLVHLAGVEAVVNCVGVLQSSPHEDIEAAHLHGAETLFRACVEASVKRIVQVSAIGVERHQASPFSASKLRGDRMLMTLPVEWVILRPALVLGAPAFGGSALIRGLAALPWLPVMPESGPLQTVTLDEVAETVAFFLRPEAPSGVTLELAGPERLSMSEIVARHRAWLGWPPARPWGVPGWMAGMLYRIGDFISVLGWRSPIRSNARREIVHGAVGDPEPWTRLTGIRPVDLADALAMRPAGVQERWFARLYLVKPMLFALVVLFWIATGVISLTTGWTTGVGLMERAGAGPLAAPGVVAGALADILIGLAIAYRPTALHGLWAAIALSVFYVVVGTILLPELWHDPLGPMLKIWPIFAAHAVALAILQER